MNKIGIFLGIIALIMVGLGTYFFLKEPVIPEQMPPVNPPSGKQGITGFIGCSITHNAIDGYLQVGGTDFWSNMAKGEENYGGGSLDTWYSQLSGVKKEKDYWSVFQNKLNKNLDTDKIWWELCSSGKTQTLTYENVTSVLNEIKKRAPDAIIYATPMPIFSDTTEGICVDNNGPKIIEGFVNKMVQDGIVKAGPVLSSLNKSQTNPDGCHANVEGQEIWGKELLSFFGSSDKTNTQDTKKLSVPYSYFSVHLENDKNPGAYFNNLKSMVKLADKYNVLLTIMFNPTWIDYVLADQTRIDEVHSWQKNGHEIALHHHGPSHGGWNGYSNMPKEDAEALHQKWNPGSKQKYIGTVDSYFSKLKQLAYPYPVNSGTVTDKWTDMPKELLYDSEGRVDGRNSKVAVNIFNGHITYRINTKADYKELNTVQRDQYNSLTSDEIYGTGCHAADDLKIIEDWFKFLYEKDKEGVKRNTISSVMENYILPNKLVNYESCGNTVCDSNEKENNSCSKDCGTCNSNYGVLGCSCANVYRVCEFGDSEQIYLTGSD